MQLWARPSNHWVKMPVLLFVDCKRSPLLSVKASNINIMRHFESINQNNNNNLMSAINRPIASRHLTY